MTTILNLFLLVLSLILAGCQQAEVPITPSGKTVKIAFLATLSGDGGHQGQSALLGIQTALKMQPYLDSGDKVEVVIEDYKGDPAKAAASMGKLCLSDDISGVLLLGNSDIALGIAPLADHYKTPVLALNATHPGITEGRHFISQLGVDDNFQGTVAALYVRDELLIDRAAVFSDSENSHYTLLATEFIERFESVGGNIAERLTEKPENGDYGEILDNLRRKKTQLLYLALDPESVLQVAEAAKKISWQPKMMGSDGLASSIMLQHPHGTNLLEGMIATDFFAASLPETAYGKKVFEIFKDPFFTHGTSYTGLACEGTSILLNAMNRCMDHSNRSCVNSMLRSTIDFEGLFETISISAAGKAERPLFINAFKKQKPKLLVKVY